MEEWVTRFSGQPVVCVVMAMWNDHFDFCQRSCAVRAVHICVMTHIVYDIISTYVQNYYKIIRKHIVTTFKPSVYFSQLYTQHPFCE